MLKQASLPNDYWPYAAITANYVKNRTFTKPLKQTMPYNMLFNKNPDLTYVKVFGCLAYVYLPKEKRYNKLSQLSCHIYSFIMMKIQEDMFVKILWKTSNMLKGMLDKAGGNKAGGKYFDMMPSDELISHNLTADDLIVILPKRVEKSSQPKPIVFEQIPTNMIVGYLPHHTKVREILVDEPVDIYDKLKVLFHLTSTNITNYNTIQTEEHYQMLNVRIQKTCIQI